MDEEPKFKFDLQGVIRTAITLGVVIGGYYHMIGVLSERSTVNEGKIKALEQKVDTHIVSIKVYTWEELTREFVTRKEWENSHKYLREDIKYIRDKMDSIFNRLSETKKI